MRAPTKVLVQLQPDEYERLALEVRRRGVPPDALAHDLLRASLPADETEADKARRASFKALELLAELRAAPRREGYPSVEAEKLAREGRDELEARVKA